jgi:hypothetical protein
MQKTLGRPLRYKAYHKGRNVKMTNKIANTHASESNVYLLANVGSNDLSLEGPWEDEVRRADPKLHERLLYAFKEKKESGNTLLWTRTIHSHIDVLRPYLKAPVLSPVLTWLQQRRVRLEQIILFATRQKAPEFRRTDTHISAQILSDILPQLHPTLISAERIKVEHITRDPHLLDWLLSTFYPQKLHKMKASRVYVCTTGGTPNSNHALMLAALAEWNRNASIVYVPRPAPGEQATPKLLNIYDFIVAQENQRILDELLQQYEFSGIARNSGFTEEIRQVAKSAVSRLNFDFLDAFEKIRSGIQKDTAATLQSVREELITLSKENSPEHLRLRLILNDLYYQASIKWQRQEYADFLGRIWRIAEITKSRWENDKHFKSAFERFCAEDGASSKVTKKSDNGLSIGDYLYLLIRFFTEKTETLPSFLQDIKKQDLVEAYTMFKNLIVLRNNSIIAHGTAPVTEETVRDAVKLEGDQIFKRIEIVIRSAGVELQDNPYDLYVKAIRKVAEKNRTMGDSTETD